MKNFHVLKVKRYVWLLLIPVIILFQLSFVAANPSPKNVESVNDSTMAVDGVALGMSSFLLKNLAVYDSLGLGEEGLSKEVYEMAIKGMEKLVMAGITQKDNIIAIADFSQPSTSKRLYIIDLNKFELKYRTWVAHGRNSGSTMAERFSNRMSSNQSSPGFYVTENTYQGKHGYSLRLTGVEKGINDNAHARAIVMHGADYVNPNLIPRLGFIGRSQGCPAIPMALHRPIINEMKDGACLFIYSAQSQYLNQSELIG